MHVRGCMCTCACCGYAGMQAYMHAWVRVRVWGCVYMCVSADDCGHVKDRGCCHSSHLVFWNSVSH